MKTVVTYVKDQEINFEEIKDRECFYSGGVLYMRILQEDLSFYEVFDANAVSILNGGLTFFNSDENVIRAIRKCETIKETGLKVGNKKEKNKSYFSKNKRLQ